MRRVSKAARPAVEPGNAPWPLAWVAIAALLAAFWAPLGAAAAVPAGPDHTFVPGDAVPPGSPPPGSPPLVEEARGLWVVRDTLKDPAAIDQMLEFAGRLGFNMLFVQVNGRAEAYYRSDIVPMATGVPEGFDPLQYLLDRARPLGIQVHGWVNAFTAGMLSSRPASPRHVLRQHPDWVLYHQSGKSLWDFGAGLLDMNLPAIMLDPGLPEVQDYVVAVIQELVSRYDIDGVHLDYMRYPSPEYGYHPRAREAFQQAVGVDPLWLVGEQGAALRQAWGIEAVDRVEEAWREWRRRQINGLMRRVYEAVAAQKPWVAVSAAVFPDPARARDTVLQDWVSWLREGTIDVVIPMAYQPDENTVYRQLQQVVAVAAGRHVYGGLGVYQLGGQHERLRAMLERVRGLNLQGIVLFSYNYLRQDASMAAWLERELPAGRPAVPPMPWKPLRSARAGS